jgi:hypothetical protein
VLAAYFCKICIQLVTSRMQISFSRMQISTSRMQISFSQPPAGCKLHPASGYPIKNTHIYQ